MPRRWKLCGDPKHWENRILFGYCWKCDRERAAMRQTPIIEAEVNGMYSRSQTKSNA